MDTDEIEEEDVVKEMFDGQYPRVDVVSGPATGMRFIVLKAGESQDPEAVAQLSDVAKAEKSTADINNLPDSDFAYIEPGGKLDDEGKTVPRSLRHFPIMDAAHVRNALSRAPQSPFGEKAMPKITAAATKFGIDVKKAKTMTLTAEPETELVIKADGVVGDDPAADVVAGDDEPLPDGDALDAEKEVNADGTGVPTESPGDPDDPDSPAWEAVDAARARQALQLTVALKRLVELAQAREAQEASVGADDDDAENVWTLSDVLDALDDVLEMIAPFAVTEQAEADERTAEQTIVLKSGRILSASNESAIRAAVESLQGVLATLPAPVADEPVAKSQESEVNEETAPVAKAKGDPMVAVYDANGTLVGTITQADLNPIAAPEAPAGGDAQGAEQPAAAPAEPDADDATDAATDDSDAGPAATGDPAVTGTAAPAAPAAPAADEEPVAKSQSDLAEVVKSAVTQAVTAVAEEYQSVLKSLEDRLANVESQPAPGGPLLSSASQGGGPVMRGQDGPQASELATVAKQLAEETDPVRQADLRREMTRLSFRQAYSQ